MLFFSNFVEKQQQTTTTNQQMNKRQANKQKTLNTALHEDVHKLIFIKVGMIIAITALYI